MFDRTPIDYNKMEDVIDELQKEGRLMDADMIITRYSELQINLGVRKIEKSDINFYSKYPHFRGFIPRTDISDDSRKMPINYVVFDIAKEEK